MGMHRKRQRYFDEEVTTDTKGTTASEVAGTSHEFDDDLKGFNACEQKESEGPSSGKRLFERQFEATFGYLKQAKRRSKNSTFRKYGRTLFALDHLDIKLWY